LGIKFWLKLEKKVYFLALCPGMKSNLQFLNHEYPEELSSGGNRYRQPDTVPHRVGRVLSVSPVVGIGTPPPL
jgi:hypothetical protein